MHGRREALFVTDGRLNVRGMTFGADGLMYVSSGGNNRGYDDRNGRYDGE